MNTPTYNRLTAREVMAARADDMDYNQKLADGMKYGRPLSRLRYYSPGVLRTLANNPWLRTGDRLTGALTGVVIKATHGG